MFEVVDFAEDMPDLSQDMAPVEVRVRMPREVLTAALYESGLSFEELAQYGAAEVRTLVLGRVLFDGVRLVGDHAERVFAAFRAGRLSSADAAWWAACAARVESVFFGGVGQVPVVVAGVSA